jgi:hypothetical protein
MVKEKYPDVALSILKINKNLISYTSLFPVFYVSNVLESSEMELEIVHKIIKEATLKSPGIFDPLGTYSNFEMA